MHSLVILLFIPAHLVINGITQSSYDFAAVEDIKCRYKSRALVLLHINHPHEDNSINVILCKKQTNREKTYEWYEIVVGQNI